MSASNKSWLMLAGLAIAIGDEAQATLTVGREAGPHQG